MKKITDLALILLPAIIFLTVWQWYTGGNQRLEFLFASPSKIFDVAVDEFEKPDIWYNIFVTVSEAALGLFGGTFLGTTAGLLLWCNGRIDKIARPYVAFIGAIPVFAVAPITIMWFGIGLLSKTVMAGFAVFFVSLLQAYEGAHAVAAEHIGFARSIGAPNRRIVQKIIVPGTIDWVIAGYKLNVGFALMGAFIGEFVSSERGLDIIF